MQRVVRALIVQDRRRALSQDRREQARYARLAPELRQGEQRLVVENDRAGSREAAQRLPVDAQVHVPRGAVRGPALSVRPSPRHSVAGTVAGRPRAPTSRAGSACRMQHSRSTCASAPPASTRGQEGATLHAPVDRAANLVVIWHARVYPRAVGAPSFVPMFHPSAERITPARRW